MNIYISVPMRGRSAAAINADIVAAEVALGELGYTPIRPVMESKKDRNTCLGEAVTAVLNADGIYLCRGWVHSEGCTLEKAAAELTAGKTIIYYDDLKK